MNTETQIFSVTFCQTRCVQQENTNVEIINYMYGCKSVKIMERGNKNQIIDNKFARKFIFFQRRNHLDTNETQKQGIRICIFVFQRRKM